MITTMTRLPHFSLDDYAAVLDGLETSGGYRFGLVSDMRTPQPAGRRAYLRHDIDIDPRLCLDLARREAEAGVRSSWFALVSGRYNVLAADCAEALCTIVGLGHELGLHYDLTVYPAQAAAAEAQLQRDLALLADVVGAPVTTLCMHQPHLGHPDPFRSRDDLVNPSDPRLTDGLTYVSDSCRAWRDETLLSCVAGQAGDRLLLTVHPELWLAPEITDRAAYLAHLADLAAAGDRDFFAEVGRVWAAHEGPRLHDARDQRVGTSERGRPA